MTNTYLLVFALIFFTACNGQGQMPVNFNAGKFGQKLSGDTVTQVEGEIRGIIQDSNNNFWYALNGNGVFKFDGTIILNSREKHGLSSDFVWMVKEGRDGKILWKTNL